MSRSRDEPGDRPDASTVTLQPGGERLRVDPGESILDAALRQGVNLPHSCRGGSCMSCAARITAGAVDYPEGLPLALSLAEIEQGVALLCQARPRGDVSVEARPIQTPSQVRVKRLPCRLIGRDALAADVMRLRLKLPAVEAFRYLAGQYVDILLEGGRRRSFSIANAPAAAAEGQAGYPGPVLELHVRRVPGGRFTSRVFEALPLKSLLRIEGPLGGLFLRDSTRPALLIAGGTGFAPLKAMIEDAFARGDARPMHLYWGARREPDLYHDGLVRRWLAERPGFRYTPVLSQATGSRWPGRRGLVHAAALADHPDLSGWQVYASGPPVMITALQQGTRRCGLEAGQLHFDSFEYGADTLAAMRG